MSTPNTHLGADKIREIMRSAAQKDVFFLGAGGIMMSSLALLTYRAGHPTAGSDRAHTAVTDSLEAEGIRICYSHAAENIPADCGLVVYTVAISPDNPEYLPSSRMRESMFSAVDFLGSGLRIMRDCPRW